MYFEPKEIILKDGRSAVLRGPRPEEAAEMLRYLDDTAAETPFLLRSPGEKSLTEEQETAYLQAGLADPDKYVIVCMVDGLLAGNCQISRRNKLKNRHRASIGIALRKDYWGLGIGTAMFEAMIAIAKEWDLMQLELEVVEGNDRAMALYRKMGFETTGFVPNAIQMPDGTFRKEFMMVKTL